MQHPACRPLNAPTTAKRSRLRSSRQASHPAEALLHSAPSSRLNPTATRLGAVVISTGLTRQTGITFEELSFSQHHLSAPTTLCQNHVLGVQVPPCASSKHLRLPCPVARASRGNDGRHRPKVRGDGDMDCRRRVCYRDYHLHRVSLSIQRAVLPLFPLRKTDFVLSSSIWLQTYDPISPILRRDDARSGTDGRTGRTIGSRFCSDTSFAFC